MDIYLLYKLHAEEWVGEWENIVSIHSTEDGAVMAQILLEQDNESEDTFEIRKHKVLA
jgi:hypothetical protein